MSGRFREICAGINVDLGTAAAFRTQWAQETFSEEKIDHDCRPQHLLLKTNQAPGDAVAMTAAIYSLHQAHPGKYLTSVDSPYPEVFAYNPRVVPTLPTAVPLHMHYPAIHQSNSRSIHFMEGWCSFLGTALSIQVPLLTNRPHLYFDTPTPPVEDYWVICSGGKSDFTNKLWGQHNYQAVVDFLPNIDFVQVGHSKDNHPRLQGTFDCTGNTTLRQLFDIIRKARGVLCGVSLLMHVAAALEVPCIVIAGGREPVAWNAYPRQQYVHTIGSLPCSSSQGEVGGACWRSRVLPLGDSSLLDKNTCEFPVDGFPRCMRMISPAHVIELVRMYDGQYGGAT